MKPKAVIKMTVDILMTLGLLFLMGYQFWGEEDHELAGVGMLALFVIHHILNLGWYKSLFKGKYNARRALTLLIDILVLASMIAQMYSGIVISKYVFVFIQGGGMAVARRVHILGAYWGFIFMSLHLGLHWDMVTGAFKRNSRIENRSKSAGIVGFIIGLAVAVYGAFAFVIRDFPNYLFLESEFVFMDYSEPAVLFYIDYIAVMGLFIFAGHYLKKLTDKSKEIIK